MIIPQHTLFEQLIFWGKVVGGLTAIGGLLIGALRWMTATVKKLTGLHTSIVTLTDTHMPEMTKGFEEMGKAFGTVREDIRLMDVKVVNLERNLTSGREAIADLNKAFITHLENSAATEETKKKKRSNGVHAVAASAAR